jgi:RecB family exonuclease
MMAAEQLSFGGMPQRLYTCTPTRLTSWLDCPRRYRMTYLDRPPLPKGPPWAHNSLGASVHNALAAWWRLPLSGRSVTAAGELLQSGWISQGFADEEQSARQRARARAMVESYVATLDPGDEPLGVERTVGTRTDRIAVSGRIDRLDERPSGEQGTELVVVDYKTGRHLLTTDSARGSLALAIYAVPPGRAAPSAHRERAQLGAHGRVTGAAVAPGRGHRRRERRGRRGLPRWPGPRTVRRGVPAASGARLWLV